MKCGVRVYTLRRGTFVRMVNLSGQDCQSVRFPATRANLQNSSESRKMLPSGGAMKNEFARAKPSIELCLKAPAKGCT